MGEGSDMKDGYAPLFMASVMIILAAILLYSDHSQRSEAIGLATEIEAFLEDHRTESAEHFTTQQKARALLNLIQSPNRAFLTMLSVIFAVQALAAFFKNTKGRRILQRAKQAWTWRP